MRKTIIAFIPILLLSILIRFFYFQHDSQILTSYDTYAYIEAGQEMVSKKVFTHPNRTPIYPYFLFFTFSPYGELKANPFATEYRNAARLTIFLQNTLGIASLLLLFLVTLS